MSELLTIDEAAKQIRMSAGWIRQAIRNKELDAVRFGRSVRIRQQELDRYVEARIEGTAQSLERWRRELEKNPLAPYQQDTNHDTRHNER